MTVRKQPTSIRAIPLNKLKKSPKNVRTTPHTTEHIEALAASIKALGMRQMPNVEPECTDKGRPTGFWLVNIGEGRRLAQLLRVKRKEIKNTEPILCLVDSASDGREISLAENAIRAPMHPADQFIAFRELVDSGKPVEDVAAHFSVSPQVVARRLKLANVHPSFIELYRAEKVTLEQLMALTLSDDHERQQKVWNSLPQYQRHPDRIRHALTENEISVREPIVRFVGIDAYTAAGGGIRRDLFAENENDGYITDTALISQLAKDKLEKKAAQLQREGHAWVEARTTLDYADLKSFGRVSSVSREPTKKEKKQLATLAKRRTELDAELAKAQEGDNDERLDELEGEAEELEAEEEELRKQRAVPNPEQQAIAGAVVSIDQNGKLRVERGLLRAEDVKRFAREQKKKERDPANATADDAPRSHSESLVRRLTAHRTLALQAVLSQRPDVALVALTHSLAEQTFFNTDRGRSPIQIAAHDVSLRQHATDLEASKAHQALAEQREAWEQKLPSENLFGWLLDQPQKDILALLAFCVAVRVDAVETREGESDADPIARAVALDMREWWMPTADTYLSSLPKSRILAVVTEAVSAEAAVPLGKLKKAPLAAAAAAQIAGTGWLPEPLRAAAA
jgi:ParB family chromosome partitioning protein